MRSHLAAAAVVLLLAACAPPPVRDELTIDLTGGQDTAVVTAESSFGRDSAETDVARAAAQDGIDPWSVRFSRLAPDAERVTLEKERGKLQRVTRSVRIPSNDLQQIFADLNVTVTLMRGEGTRELALYPGTSTRASREQQQRVAREVEVWSTLVANYINAVNDLYTYMNAQPQRARYLFAAVLRERGTDGAEPVVTEDEQPLVDDVLRAMDAIAERMDAQEGDADSLRTDFDAAWNAFPARVVVNVGSDVLFSEGFEIKDGRAVIEPLDLYAAFAGLEGRWVSPDPLAALLREDAPTAAQLAEAPRRSTLLVRPSDVSAALRESRVRPQRYVVRWRE